MNEVIEEEPAGAKAKPEPARKDRADKAKAPKPTKAPEAPGTPPVPAAKAPGPSKASQPVARASEAQKRAIFNLSKRRKMTPEELEKFSLEAYGTQLAELSSADASQMIRHLQQSA